MLLKRLTFSGFGPFLQETSIEFSDDVTVITGANDVGKSQILSLISKLYMNVVPDEHEFHDDIDRSSLKSIWPVEYRVSSRSDFYMDNKGGQKNGDKVIVDWNHTTNARPVRNIIRDDKEIGSTVFTFRPNHLPQIIAFPPLDLIEMTITEDHMKPRSGRMTSAALLMQAGFGEQPFERIKKKLLNAERSRLEEKANKRINLKLREILPEALPLSLKLKIRPDGSEVAFVDVLVEDPLNGVTNLDHRGGGIRRIVSILAHLMSTKPNEQVLIVIDEPENSLHADAQHALRDFLEQLAANDWCQVVYSTHSPAMINPLRPDSVRLVVRDSTVTVGNGDAYPTSRIVEHPYANNSAALRVSLGLQPADALAVAPYVLLVEGETEAICIGQVLARLATTKQNIIGSITSQAQIICASTESRLESYASIVTQMSSKVLIIMDRDNPSLKTILEKYGKVIAPLSGLDFETVIAREHYFNALSAYISRQVPEFDLTQITQDKFDEWLTINSKYQLWGFGSQLEHWLGSMELRLDKPEVAPEALRNTPDSELLDSPYWKTLLEALSRLVSN